MQDIATTSNGQASGNRSLVELARDINREHNAAIAKAADAIECAMRCGGHLKKAKAAAGHGKWRTWLAVNSDISERTASNYMRLFENRLELDEQIGSDNADLTISGAIKLLADAKKPKFYAIPEDQWEFPLESEGGFLPASPDSTLEYRSDVAFANGAVGAVELVPDEVGGWRVFVAQINEPDDQSDRLLGYYRSRGAFIWFKFDYFIVGGHIPDHFRSAIAAAGWRSRPADPAKLKRINAEERELYRQELEAYNASLKEAEEE